MDIRQWLETLGLSQYAKTFADNDIDLEVARLLTDADLEKLGVSLGHRKKLLVAAGTLAAPTRSQPENATKKHPGPERRQLTALFCDLAGSTEMSTQLDPEELREVIGAYQRNCTEVIGRFQGYVAKYMGDGLLAYFGYPQAREDDANRAVHAGLAIVQAIGHAPSARTLAVRIGIATGEVVVGDQIGIESSRESAVVGETPNLAARLQASAEPNSVMVADHTRNLTRQEFAWAGPQTLSLKGFSTPVIAWRAVGEATGADELVSPAAALSTRMVGRQAELALFRERLEAAVSGEGQVLLLIGGAGIGKSRITAAMMEEARARGIPCMRLACSPSYQASELKPLATWIEREAGIDRTAVPEENLRRLATWLGKMGIAATEDARVFAALLSLPCQLGDLTPAVLRSRTLRMLETLIIGTSHDQPTVLVFEDVHWIDPSSAELLSRLVDRAGRSRLLIIVNARPEFEGSWQRLPQVTVLTLNRLLNRDAAALIEQTAGVQTLPANVVEPLLARAQGNPFFLQELTKSAVHSLSGRATQTKEQLDELVRTIPATLRDLLMERLDRLGPAKAVAQAIAVIGQEFDERLLAAVIDPPAAERQKALDHLLEAQIIVRQGGDSAYPYAFRHALIHDVAYQSLLKATRRDYHRRIAESLERGTIPDLGDREPELIAHHYTEAGEFDRAIEFWHSAGTRAAQRSANLEGVKHLNQGLELVRKHASGETRSARELSLLIALGPLLMATRGWNAPEVRAVYDETMRLASETGRSLEMFPAVWGRWLTAHAGGEAQSARDLLQQLFALIEDHKNVDLEMQAHHAGCSTMMTDGEFAKSLRHMDAALALYDINSHRHQATRYGGHDPCVCMQCIGALAEMVFGHAGRSRQLSAAAQKLADKVGHTPSSAHENWYRSELLHIVNEPGPAIQLAENVLKVGLDMGLVQYVAQARMVRGWGLTLAGQSDRGIGEMEEGLAELRATHVAYHMPHRLGLRAQIYALAGRVDKAIEAADDAIASVEQTGERWYEAEALRIKAGVLATKDKDAAKKLLEQAIAVADKQGARLWAARARLDLARLIAPGQRNAAAQGILAPVVAWGSDVDIPERQRTKAMLDQLGN